MNRLNIWHFIQQKIEHDGSVALMMVPQSIGSSPGRQGHLMAIANDDSMYGTIGGGAMEYKQVEACKKHLKAQQTKPLYQRLTHEKKEDADWSGLSCSGEQTILSFFLYPVDKILIEEILDKQNDRRWSLVCTSDGRLACVLNEVPLQRYMYHFGQENEWSYQFMINQRDHVFIIGAGHVGQALCRQLHFLDFDITLIDNRKKLPTEETDTLIHQKVICNYKKVANFVLSSPLDYIVIMSFSSALDQLILSQLIQKPCKYIGMMASSTKAQRIRAALQKKGLDSALLERVHTPIGISLSCKSPAEIAVSVAAQMIQIRNQTI